MAPAVIPAPPAPKTETAALKHDSKAAETDRKTPPRAPVKTRAGNKDWMAEGRRLENEGKLEDAAKAYQSAAREQPENAEAFLNLGVTYEMLGQQDEALDAFKTVVRLSPRAAGAWYNLGRTQAALGQAHDAVASFSKAVEINPDYAEAHLGLGLMYDQLEEGKKAITHTEGARRLFLAASRKDLAQIAQQNLANLQIKYSTDR